MPRHRLLGAALMVTAVALAVAMLGSGLTAVAQPAGEPECPVGLVCRFTPAAYAQTDPGDPNAYGNYDPERPNDDNGIHYIVIHDTEESYDSAIANFQKHRTPSSCLPAAQSLTVPASRAGNPYPETRSRSPTGGKGLVTPPLPVKGTP